MPASRASAATTTQATRNASLAPPGLDSTMRLLAEMLPGSTPATSSR